MKYIFLALGLCGVALIAVGCLLGYAALKMMGS